MRAKILGLLRERMPEPVSGEEISAKLGVSRTAVWKHIQSLKNTGYDIESVPKKGYILHKAPDLLSPEEIVAHLKTKWVGHHIHYLKEASSSNEVGKRLASGLCGRSGRCGGRTDPRQGASFPWLVFPYGLWGMVQRCPASAVHALGSVQMYSAGSGSCY